MPHEEVMSQLNVVIPKELHTALKIHTVEKGYTMGSCMTLFIRQAVVQEIAKKRGGGVAYTIEDYKTKKALRKALDNGEKISVFQPGPFGPNVKDGVVYLEGPHYPKAHSWYASVKVRDGVLIKGTLK